MMLRISAYLYANDAHEDSAIESDLYIHRARFSSASRYCLYKE